MRARKDRVNEIDLLRLLAALAVVFYHYAFRGFAADNMSALSYPALAGGAKYGYLGVQLFFMISGFVILMSAARGSLKDFIVSRIVRLYPAFWACCTMTFALILLMGAPRYTASGAQYLFNMTMLSGFFDVPSIDGSYWSLFVELRFYGLVALILLARRMQNAELLLSGWLVASCALEVVPVGRLRSLFIADYSAYFISGAAFFLIWANGLSITRSALIIVGWALAMWQSVAALPAIEAHYGTAMSGATVVLVITSFFVVMSLVSLRLTGSFSQRRWLTLGSLTYPLYLLHQTAGFMIFNRAHTSVNPHVLFWGTTIAMLAAAHAISAHVERRCAATLKNGLDGALTPVGRLARISLTTAAARLGI